MELNKENVKQLMKSDFFNTLGLIGESFMEFMETEDEQLTDAYLDYMNKPKPESEPTISYPVFCFMAMTKIILEMQLDGEIDLR